MHDHCTLTILGHTRLHTFSLVFFLTRSLLILMALCKNKVGHHSFFDEWENVESNGQDMWSLLQTCDPYFVINNFDSQNFNLATLQPLLYNTWTMRIKFVKNTWTLRVRENHCIWAYLSFIQYEGCEIICNPEVTFLVKLIPNS